MPGKVKYHELSDNEKKVYLGEFYSVIASLENRDQVKMFFKDLLTLSEITMISRRIQIAKMLLMGEKQEDIRAKLKVGFNNIAQVEKWLNNGFGGYRLALDRCAKGAVGDKKKTPRGSGLGYICEPSVLEQLRRRYPAHFALVGLFMDKKKKK
jgi:TrpR-related protein YerC/YecD